MKRLVLIAVIIIVSGCATYRPIVDSKGIDQAKYEVDLTECQAYAKQVNPAGEAAVGAGAGGAFGAVIGGIAGAFIGKAGRGAAMGAALGGTSGAASGAAGGAKGQVGIIKQCLTGRGYKVLR